jgi:predicted small secreted protein
VGCNPEAKPIIIITKGIIMSAFKARNKMLKMARHYLEKQYKIKKHTADKVFKELVKSGQKVDADYTKYMPEMYPFEDIIAKAKMLSDFTMTGDK